MENNEKIEAEIKEKISNNSKKVLKIVKEHKDKNNIDIMANITKQAFSEVYDIICHMDLEKEIPNDFLELINKNRDVQYKVNIDYSKSINEQELQKGTRVLLAIIYREYLCSEEERNDLIRKDKEELNRIEAELREKYNPNNLFKKGIDKKY